MQRPIGLGAPPRGLTSCGASDPQNCTHNLFPAPTPACPVAPPAWSPRPPLHHCCCAATCLVMPSQVPTKAPPSPPGHLAPPGSWLPVGITLIPLTPPVLIPRKPPEVTQGLRLTWALNPALTQLPSARAALVPLGRAGPVSSRASPAACCGVSWPRLPLCWSSMSSKPQAGEPHVRLACLSLHVH